MHADIRKHRLHDPQPPGVDALADYSRHCVGQAFRTLAPHCVWCSAGEYQVEYDPLSVNEYQKQYDAQQVKYMKKKAARLGYELVPA